MNQTNMIVINERQTSRREIRNAAGIVGLGSLLYSFVGTKILEFLHLKDMAYIPAMIIAALAVFLCVFESGTYKDVLRKNKAMTWKSFGSLLCVFYLFNMVGTNIYLPIRWGLNLFGCSTELSEALASDTNSSVWIFVYGCFLAPILEELVFRGFLLRRMKKCGKIIAICVSAMFFGLMHENLSQIFRAMMIGLVLGYVAMEYSVVWSIALHMFHNLVCCDLFGRLSEYNTTLGLLAISAFVLATIPTAIIIMVRKREAIGSWIRENRAENPNGIWAVTSLGVIAAVAYHICNTIRFISLG